MLWWGAAEAQGSAECQGPVSVLAINNNSVPPCSELGCSSGAQSSHQHCSLATNRQGAVIFSKLQTAAPDSGCPAWPTGVYSPSFPFSPQFCIFPYSFCTGS